MQTDGIVNISTCHFTVNYAADDGGAIYVKTRVHMAVYNSQFKGNVAEDSGGSLLVDDSCASIDFSKFESGFVSHGYGGAICAIDIAEMKIQNSQFINCTAKIGGTLSVMLMSTLCIQYSSVTNSMSNTSAGAIYIYYHSQVNSRNVSLLSSESEFGGGIFSDEFSSLFWKYGLIHDNVAYSQGGGIFCNESTMELSFTTISWNKAGGSGGGLYQQSCQTKVNSLLIKMNTGFSNGGGIYVVFGRIGIHYSQAEGNKAGKMGGLIAVTRSMLLCKHLETICNIARSGSIFAIINSYAKINFLHHIHDDSYCPIVGLSSSTLIIQDFFGTSKAKVARPQTNSSELVCRDNTSIITGANNTGTLFEFVMIDLI